MVQILSFRDLQQKHFPVFRVFGVVPAYRKDPNGELKRSPLMTILVSIFLFIYWTGVVFCLFNSTAEDRISIVSNWIQLLANSLAMTVSLVTSVTQFRQFDHLLVQFENIDAKLLQIKVQMDYKCQQKTSKLIFFGYLSVLTLAMVYDFFIYVVWEQILVFWYWLICVVPLIIYSVALYNAMFMINWITQRCSSMNQLLKKIRSEGDTYGHFNNESMLLLNGNVQIIGGKQTRQISVNPSQTPLSQLVSIVNDLCKLSRKMDNYFGLFFLVVVGAMFSVICIQVYYSYLQVVAEFNTKTQLWVCVLIVSIDLVVLNVALVIGLVSVCERVGKESTRILQNIGALQLNQKVPSLNEMGVWVQPMISSIKFSAYDFFTLNYSTLGGLITALITYLVILIQFHSLDKGMKNTARAVIDCKSN